ncbi:MAG: hypothetical protein Q9191_004652 [Dirinaria sp. TL-2023a]
MPFQPRTETAISKNIWLNLMAVISVAFAVFAINTALRYTTACLLSLVEILEIPAAMVHAVCLDLAEIELAAIISSLSGSYKPMPRVRDSERALCWAHWKLYEWYRTISTRSKLKFVHSVLSIKPSLLLLVGVIYVASVWVGAYLLLMFSQSAEQNFGPLVLRVRQSAVDWRNLPKTFIQKARGISKSVLQSVDRPPVSESIPQKATGIDKIFDNPVEQNSLRKTNPPQPAAEDRPMPLLRDVLLAVKKERQDNLELDPKDLWLKIEKDFGRDSMVMARKILKD